MHLSRPMYESLPWLYIAAGVGALGGSYFFDGRARGLSLLAGLVGLAVLLGGIVVLLRRRDYRQLGSQYEDVNAAPGGDQD